jgi:hypothetical protein
MSELNFSDLPERFFSIAIFPEILRVFCAEKATDLDFGYDIFQLDCNQWGGFVQGITKVPFYAAAMLAQMSDHMTINDIARDQLPALVLKTVREANLVKIRMLHEMAQDTSRSADFRMSARQAMRQERTAYAEAYGMAATLG